MRTVLAHAVRSPFWQPSATTCSDLATDPGSFRNGGDVADQLRPTYLPLLKPQLVVSGVAITDYCTCKGVAEKIVTTGVAITHSQLCSLLGFYPSALPVGGLVSSMQATGCCCAARCASALGCSKDALSFCRIPTIELRAIYRSGGRHLDDDVSHP